MPSRQSGIPKEVVEIGALQIAGRNLTSGEGPESGRISNCAADLYRSARGLEVVWMRQVIRFDPNWIAGVWPAQTKSATALWSNNSPEKPPSSGRHGKSLGVLRARHNKLAAVSLKWLARGI
jgi:hypothetical protein